MWSSLARISVRYRAAVVGAWAVLAVLGVVLGGSVFDRTSDVADSPAGSESAVARDTLDRLDPEGPIISAVLTGRDFFSSELIGAASTIMFEVREIPGVVTVTDAYTGGGLIGNDGQSSLVVIELDETLSDDDARVAADNAIGVLRTIPGVQVTAGGPFLSEQAFIDRAIADTSAGEGVAIVLIVVLLTVVLGGFLAGLLPVVAAFGALLAALLALSAATSLVSINDFAVNVLVVLSLGLGVDYALLLMLRFRDERSAHPTQRAEDLIVNAATRTARAIVSSGCALAIALFAMLLLGDPLLSGMAAGGLATVVGATLSGLTLAPALLSYVHPALPARAQRTWSRPFPRPLGRPGLLGVLARAAQQRPKITALSGLILLVILALPLGGLVTGGTDSRALPVNSAERQTQLLMEQQFPDIASEEIEVLIQAPQTDPAVGELYERVLALPNVIEAERMIGLPDTWSAFRITAPGESGGQQAQALVGDIRSLSSTVNFDVTGTAAEIVDTTNQLIARSPLALSAMALGTIFLLWALTRSVIIPVKALLLNAATVAATLGVLVALFPWGWGAGFLGFEPWGGLDVTTPLLIGMLAFGLSMDYQVFVLARVTEEWRARPRGESVRSANARAVLAGIDRTGPVVTLAAAAICLVFAGFAAGSLLPMKEIGVGMLIAIALDVTLIRGLLLPALMTLLGGANWWPGKKALRMPADDSAPAARKTPFSVHTFPTS